MKQKITTEMKKQIIVYSSSLLIVALVFLILTKMDTILSVIKFCLNLLLPFILGAGIAFVLHKPQAWLEHKMKMKLNHISNRKIRLISTLIVFICAILFIALFLSISVPAIIDSLQIFVLNLGEYGQTLVELIYKFAKYLELDSTQLEQIINSFNLTGKITSYITKTIPMIANYSYSIISGAFDFILAIVSGIYILMDHEAVQSFAKKFTYLVFDEGISDYLCIWINDAKTIFEKYIVGSLFDSLIVGVVCYIGMLILKMPYAPMIGLIIGVTNIIPVFGPFLGAIPVIILLLLIRPLYAIEFAIFIVVLQQIDGNIIKPIVLGDQLGINGFWILFAVTVGGGLFGVIGMFLGVPVFALIYATIKEICEIKLKGKKTIS
ncbi:AI-2E family transporter [Floccifex sp.]|uniref:AI-2E family transporter n=1 Tax=Floccifex sp. TaxID=2815810 RepID=UPI002A76430C|nr:AI-2E family transporter [Floccifex sp.]MDD7281176.1 AI-2E family transporter [Erysipelotrichaceae bacterium]MDY2958683.1 AI-2E family transporter [Floccifex sp.]